MTAPTELVALDPGLEECVICGAFTEMYRMGRWVEGVSVAEIGPVCRDCSDQVRLSWMHGDSHAAPIDLVEWVEPCLWVVFVVLVFSFFMYLAGQP